MKNSLRVRYKLEGGVAHFPKLAKPVTFDCEELPEEEAGELTRLVNEAQFFEQPDSIGKPSKGAADYRRYTITVEEADRVHTINMVDPVTDTKLQALLDYLWKLRVAGRGSLE
jgi:hypothetical protein